jgi:hypothetical protein
VGFREDGGLQARRDATRAGEALTVSVDVDERLTQAATRY